MECGQYTKRNRVVSHPDSKSLTPNTSREGRTKYRPTDDDTVLASNASDPNNGLQDKSGC